MEHAEPTVPVRADLPAAVVPSRVVSWLETPAAYPHGPARVERIDTHISIVFLAGCWVYKLKKTVQFDFVDFSTLAARERACREEVRLNQRLAPDTYWGVVPVSQQADGTLALEGVGQVVEWLVKMRRLDTDSTLLELHKSGRLQRRHVEQLAERMVRFYASQTPLRIEPSKYRSAFKHHVHDNGRVLMAKSQYVDRLAIQRVQGFQLQLLNLYPQLFDQRVTSGRLFDGHGDLRPEHICYGDALVIFDCVEFSAELRQIDAADELAFLAAECDFIDAGWVGTLLLERYREQSGDAAPAILVDFYKAYRACVRAKVAALRADQQTGGEREASVAEVEVHLRLADQYAASHLTPWMIVVGGRSGTGKSTLARALADRLGAELLRSDVVREEMFATTSTAPTNQGRYEPSQRQRVYAEMIRRAQELLDRKGSVVLDGTFGSSASIQVVLELLASTRCQRQFIECQCREEVARQRIVARLCAGTDASQATLEVYQQQAKEWEAWPPETEPLKIDTEAPTAEQVDEVVAVLRKRAANLAPA